MIIEITNNNFQQEVVKADKKVILDFWASWCMPCKMMHPVLEELDKECGENVKVCKINIDEYPELASKYNVMSIPTFIIFDKGEIVNSAVGVQSIDKLKSMLGI